MLVGCTFLIGFSFQDTILPTTPFTAFMQVTSTQVTTHWREVSINNYSVLVSHILFLTPKLDLKYNHGVLRNSSRILLNIINHIRDRPPI